MARRKQEAIDVPGSPAEAVALIESYVRDERAALGFKLAAEERIDAAKVNRDFQLAAIDARQKVRFAQLKAWWEAGGKEAAGAKRSAAIGGATLGVRTTPPALKLPKGRTAKQVIGELLGWLGGAFVRTVHELDKPAILAQLRKDLGPIPSPTDFHDRRVLTEELGLSVIQKDEFFIDAGLDEAVAAREPAAG